MWILTVIIITSLLASALTVLITAIMAGRPRESRSDSMREQEDAEQLEYLKEWRRKREEKQNARTLHKKLQSGAIPSEISGRKEMPDDERCAGDGEEGDSERKLFSDKS